MKIEKIVTGYLEENCYVVYDTDTKKCFIVDPGSDEEKIDKVVTTNDLKVVAVLITHNHFDHIGALDYFVDKYKPKVYDFEYVDEIIKVGDFIIEVIPTSGHTDKDVSFYLRDEGVMFTGDFLFKGTVGRFDFDNSDVSKMNESINFIKTFDPKTKIYPGHGANTTLNNELKNNEYLN